MSRALNAYLADINSQAEDLFYRLVKEMATRDGVTEKLKEKEQMRWVQVMNNIRNRAMEIVNTELVYK